MDEKQEGQITIRKVLNRCHLCKEEVYRADRRRDAICYDCKNKKKKK